MSHELSMTEQALQARFQYAESKLKNVEAELVKRECVLARKIARLQVALVKSRSELTHLKELVFGDELRKKIAVEYRSKGYTWAPNVILAFQHAIEQEMEKPCQTKN